MHGIRIVSGEGSTAAAGNDSEIQSTRPRIDANWNTTFLALNYMHAATCSEKYYMVLVTSNEIIRDCK